MQISKKLNSFISKYINYNNFTYKPLKKGFSNRNIYRVNYCNVSFIAVESDLTEENIAFIEFTKSFKKLNLKVPEILAISDDITMYLTTDLGEKTLFDFINENIKNRGLLLNFYNKAIKDLFTFQTIGSKVIDYKYCYQTNSFNSEQIISDENKFLDYYGKYLPEYDIDFFQNSFNTLNKNLTSVSPDYFIYRDFQPRNIIINNNELFYIDYQSGRKGPLQYDLASFLYSGSIDLTNEERNILIDNYLSILRQEGILNNNFMETFNYFIIIRLLQMIGSYAYQIKEKRTELSYFKNKIKKVIVHLNAIEKAFIEKDIKAMLDKIIFIHI